MATTQKSLVLFVNGLKVVDDNPNPTTTLLQYLRRKLKLTGTKNGCNQGGCGSCTVMLSWWDRMEQQIKHCSVNACLVLVCQLHGYAITTVEGVGSTRHGLSQVQTRLVESFGIQCGFCTPGMVMTMHTLLQNDNNPSNQTLEKVLEGNLCRCTGYRPIVDAFRTFCKKDCSNQEECAGRDIEDIGLDNYDKNTTSQAGSISDKSSGKLEFPNELKKEVTTCLEFRNEGWCWFRPVKLGEVFRLMDQYPDCRIIMGATRLGEQIKSKKITHGTLISCTHVEEMMVFEQTDDCIKIGAALTLTDIDDRLKACTLSQSERDLRGHVIKAIQDSIRLLANQQIRNQAPVLSTKAHARITCVDRSEAMTTPGVVDFLDVTSTPGENRWGPLTNDEPVFAEKEVFCVGQTICAVVATSKEAARRAADLVRVTYVDLPSIVTIEDAIAADSYFEYNTPPIACGDPDQHFPHCDFMVEGQVRSGFQEHFYLEPSGALVVPKNESGEMEIFTTTQSPSICQSSASRILGIPMNKIIVRQKRLGGGFGGREFRTPLAFGPAAIAAQRLGKPVRTIMDRSVDFKTTGKRHEFVSKYKAGFRRDGMLEAVSIHFYINAGYTLDASSAILENASIKADAAYKTPVFAVHGHVCKTNIPSNTSMRSFGAVEAVFAMEAILCKVADTVGLDQEHVRELNMYREGSLTHCKRKLENCMLQRCWLECILQSQFGKRRTAVQLYNSQNKHTKRGIAVMPLKFGIGYHDRHLNQGAALVNIYLDGSVMIAHGGVEMGQGLHTKMIQVASRALGIPVDKIYISETGTNTCPNTTPTSASITSDLQGAAVLDACRKINKRLRPYQEKEPSGQWTAWINQAYLDRVSLSATGFSRPDNYYYTYGAACTEVEIDCLTGAHQVLQTDIVMDIGDSLNPGIDVGQIEGGFVQGYGWITMEELRISPDGHILADGPVDYKIPRVRNIPRQMKVYILKDCPSTGTVYSSKGVGEPPLNLAISVYIALREAIRACRMDAGITSSFDLDIPLTSEKIRMACTVKIPTKENKI